MKITTHPERKDIPRQLIQLEIANIESYSREPVFLKMNYPFLPDSYADLFLMAESIDELITDKIIDFVNSSHSIRYRDIWDLHFLLQKNAQYHHQWLLNKIQDYGILAFPGKIQIMRAQLSDIIEGAVFFREMNRFLPSDIQEKTILNPLFRTALGNQLQSLFQRVSDNLITG